MAGMQFEYDEKGGTFYYFLLSFLALILIPATYYLWPRRTPEDEETKDKKVCRCEPCQIKRQRIKAKEPWTKFRRQAIMVGLFIGWVIFFLVAYKTSQVELDFTEFDPYKELEIDRGATVQEIKKAYRRLSLIYHPDRDGDPVKFMKITKAHQALTDEEARENWEKHGNPDGPGATHFGIALPKWIVEKQNSVWVLAAYGLVFMVILPLVVGTWWYRSIKYSAEQILMDTTQLYYYFFHKTPNMMLKRVIMILGASFEFEKSHNSEIVERPSDNEEIPALMRDLQHLNEKNKEKPLCYPYSVKARAMLHAHFSRLELPHKTLELDRQYVIKKCPYLVNEMVNIVAQLVALSHAGKVTHSPRLDTIENVMKLSPMIVQALWNQKSPLLQLPHLTEDNVKHFVVKRKNIRTLEQFIALKDEEKRILLRNFSNEEYQDIINVCSMLPDVTMEISSKVLDDEDTTITAGSIVTVSVRLIRKNMEIGVGIEEFASASEPLPSPGVEDVELADEDLQDETQNTESPAKQKPKVWEKQQKKKKGKGGKGGAKGKGGKKPTLITKKIVSTVTPAATTNGSGDGEKSEGAKDSPQPNGNIPKKKKSRQQDDSHSTDDESYDESENEAESDAERSTQQGDDEDDWMKFQEESRKENSLEAKSKETHRVHCPYYPADKQEWWWLYIADRKHHLLITAPVLVCSLKQEEEVQLKFSAPKPGLYQYTVILRSDSYLDFDQSQNIKLDVKEAKKIENHPQWDISDDEEKGEEEEGSESEGSTDYEDSD